MTWCCEMGWSTRASAERPEQQGTKWNAGEGVTGKKEKNAGACTVSLNCSSIEKRTNEARLVFPNHTRSKSADRHLKIQK